ncbi:hypothetical protein V2151_28595 [Bacillus cereus]|uniref:hypothetical protein n=1 Tax=Bacillus cereus TaxID=1396 RepID=UPI0026731D12|nr:hypothetical protein [Bacillus cereus]WKT65263.1 hypothetical protein Q2U85_01890 [Bacillus cereus]HEF5710462.1 hypothetical protein [Bacillus cereus]
MYNETLFHGSNRARGEKMISKQIMEISRGKSHWLGDGSYLFVEDFYSYKWILDMFKERHNLPEDYSNVIKHYLILTAKVCTEKSRVFDLTKAEHKMLFDKVHKELRIRAKIADKDMAEGVVLNYMFNTLNYAKMYDMVRAIFNINEKKYVGFKTRQGHMPQEQVCIKNQNIVKDVEEYNCKDRVETFEILINDMYYDKNKVKPNTYNMNKRNQHYNTKRTNPYTVKVKVKKSNINL